MAATGWSPSLLVTSNCSMFPEVFQRVNGARGTGAEEEEDEDDEEDLASSH